MIDEDNKRRYEASTDLISESIISKQGPFVPEIYAAPESDIKTPNFDSFTGASDSRDAGSFIYAFRERMRMRNAPDAVMCRLFSTLISREAWEWFMTLPPTSIKTFEDFM